MTGQLGLSKVADVAPPCRGFEVSAVHYVSFDSAEQVQVLLARVQDPS